MTKEITFEDISNFMSSYVHYFRLGGYVTQLEKGNSQLEEIYKNIRFEDWVNINIHITSQVWGSTAVGWGGMGGAMMTNCFNFIIHNKKTDTVFVYWNGKLAFIAHKKDIPNLERIPSLLKAKAIYKNIKNNRV